MHSGYFGYRILLLGLILTINAFFAAAEVSLVSVRRSKLRHMAEEGQTGATAALELLANPERLLSVTQLGVTLASLGLGWTGEGTLFELLMAIFSPILPPGWEAFLHGACFGLAFLLMSYAHVVIGEVLPKNIGLERADRLAVLVAPPLLVFYRVSGPFVAVIEKTATMLSRLAGVRGDTHGGGHSPEELKFIIQSSGREGHLEDFEEDALQRMIDLGKYSAREIMVPRNGIVSVQISSTLDQVLRLMIEHQYSRLPVYENTPENLIGIVHYKDLLPVWEERRQAIEKRRPMRQFRLSRLVRKALVVPETKPLNQLVDEFRKNRTHMALVVDEFGTIAGLITLEDVLEQIFGEIEDEHDERRQAPAKGAPVMEFDGSTNIRDLENQYGIVLPTDSGFETLAGFLMYKLGIIPKPGDSIAYETRRYTITEMDRNRIVKVRVENPAAEKTA